MGSYFREADFIGGWLISRNHANHFRVSYFERLFASVTLRTDSSIALLRDDGILLARFPSNEQALGMSFKGSSLFTELLANASSGIITNNSPIDGKLRVISAKRLARFPAVIVVSGTVHSALAVWREIAIYTIGLALTLILVIATAVWSSIRLLGDYRKSKESAERMARHDSLTGLPNRVLIREELEASFRELSVSGRRFALLLLDLDEFKLVNDTLGHSIGDELLRLVADRLRRAVGQRGIVARLGGDEFAILLAQTGSPEDLSRLSEQIIADVAAPYFLLNHTLNVGVSIGIALSDDSGDPGQLLKSADIAVYRAKAEGRGTARLFLSSMGEAIQARLALEGDLRSAITRGEFELFYQPIIRLDADQIGGFEALVRWRHPVRGMVGPSEFIPLAEETGLITQLGEWVLREACREAVSWPDKVHVAVNLSAVQFKSGNLVQLVFSALAASKLAPSRLDLEITESVLLQDNDSVLSTLHQIRALGVRIALDDFGTGFSSLSYLRKFPFDRIKIDRSFVGEMCKSAGGVAIVRAITSLAGSLGMTTTAEGVENLEQLELLRVEGCTDVQGYLFSPPRPACDVNLILAHHGRGQTAAA